VSLRRLTAPKAEPREDRLDELIRVVEEKGEKITCKGNRKLPASLPQPRTPARHQSEAAPCLPHEEPNEGAATETEAEAALANGRQMGITNPVDLILEVRRFAQIPLLATRFRPALPVRPSNELGVTGTPRRGRDTVHSLA
jgi:hypothetical protein